MYVRIDTDQRFASASDQKKLSLGLKSRRLALEAVALRGRRPIGGRSGLAPKVTYVDIQGTKDPNKNDAYQDYDDENGVAMHR